jgi:hypothetical protein
MLPFLLFYVFQLCEWPVHPVNFRHFHHMLPLCLFVLKVYIFEHLKKKKKKFIIYTFRLYIDICYICGSFKD